MGLRNSSHLTSHHILFDHVTLDTCPTVSYISHRILFGRVTRDTCCNWAFWLILLKIIQYQLPTNIQKNRSLHVVVCKSYFKQIVCTWNLMRLDILMRSLWSCSTWSSRLLLLSLQNHLSRHPRSTLHWRHTLRMHGML